MSVQDFQIEKGRVYDITVTVTGIGDWTDLIAKMYWRKRRTSGTPDLTLAGSINIGTSVITFPVTAANSASLDKGHYEHEVVIYNASKTIVYAPLTGEILVNEPIVEDPTA
jgi:hypothetical protein